MENGVVPVAILPGALLYLNYRFLVLATPSSAASRAAASASHSMSVLRRVTDVFTGMQRPLQILVNYFLWVDGRCSDQHLYPILIEKLLGPHSHAAGDDHACALATQPLRYNSGLMDGRLDPCQVHHLGVPDIEEREVLTTSEVRRKDSVISRDRYSYL